MTDLMNIMLISSVVSSLRVKLQKRSKSISPEVLKLIQELEFINDDENDDNESDNNDDDN